MKNQVFVFLFAGAFFFNACKTTFSESAVDYISVSAENSSNIKLSNLFSLSNFSLLEDKPDYPLRSVTKVLFTDQSIIIVDAETDFHNIYRFDLKSGNFLNKIGVESEQENGYQHVYDIDLDEKNKEIVALSMGNMSFMTYDYEGNLIKKIYNGVYGEHFALLPDGGFVVYNELNASDISGLNMLLFYDREGNVVKRSIPYPKSADSWGYRYTGFLNKSGENIFFSPPFSDTVYSIGGNKIIPEQVIDFKGREVPVAQRFKKMQGWDTDNNSFLEEGIVRLGNRVLFRFFENQKSNLGIYLENSGQFINARATGQHDPLYELLQLGKIFPKGEHQFALVLEPNRSKYLVEQKPNFIPELKKTYPELAKTLQGISKAPKYLLLYFEPK